jgi:hypothetical protein
MAQAKSAGEVLERYENFLAIFKTSSGCLQESYK